MGNAFRKYSSFQKAKVIRDKRTGKTKGYGFVSFSAPEDMVAALRDVNGRYVGNRPVRLKKSNWKDKSIDSDKNKWWSTKVAVLYSTGFEEVAKIQEAQNQA